MLYRLDLDVAGVRALGPLGGRRTSNSLSDELAAAGLGDADIDELALRVCACERLCRTTFAPENQRQPPGDRNRLSQGSPSISSPRAKIAPPLTSVQDQLRQLIAERKLNDEIERWVTRALEEREVTRFVR